MHPPIRACPALERCLPPFTKGMQLAFSALLCTKATLGSTTIESYYQDPFDLGAGGTVLTWSTQESMILNNPANLPHGKKFFRWLGARFNLSPGLDSLDYVRRLSQAGEENNPDGNQGSGSNENGGEDPLGILANFKVPVRLGASAASSFILNNGGFCAFASTSPDVRYWDRGDPELGTGVPNLVLRTETYGGANFAAATRLVDWFSLGISIKALQIAETLNQIELTDLQAIAELESTFTQIGARGLESGFGLDGGGLIFLQGRNLDLRLAATASNIGQITLSSGRILEQQIHGGLGLSFHTKRDVIHLSAEVRDITRAYSEVPDYKRIRLGTRVLLRGFLGLAAGIYHGSPSYGIQIDLILARLAATYYIRELAASPGVDARKILVFSVSQGLSF